ncbi:MAG: class I SAM-dependent methyltransferase [Ferrimicrobium sp.]|jgi:SAM-dependent methyltransferase|nr:class I SAM-dependent methyltransferase [Ferrimicrobium sp.]
MEREQIILHGLDLERPGLEIGPSHRPVVPKRSGYDVTTLDSCTAEELRRKYRDDVDISQIEEVDLVWHGESYIDLVGDRRFAWIIASHVIEHVPDLIGLLQSCESILTDDGVISLVIPDKRYSFDYYRPISSIGSVIDAHLDHRVEPSVGDAIDYYLSTVRRSGVGAWYKGFHGDDEIVHGIDQARIVAKQQDPYAVFDQFDPHLWIFVPQSLRLMLEDLFDLGYLGVRECYFHPTTTTEFYLQLSRGGAGNPMERIDALKQQRYELFDDSYVLPEGFDRERYLELNPDVAEAHLDPTFHWLTYGAIEGRPYR